MLPVIAIGTIVLIPVLLLIGDTLRLGRKAADPLAGKPHGPLRPAQNDDPVAPQLERRAPEQLPFVGVDRRLTVASAPARRPIVVPAEVQQEQLDQLLASMNAVRRQPLPVPHRRAS